MFLVRWVLPEEYSHTLWKSLSISPRWCFRAGSLGQDEGQYPSSIRYCLHSQKAHDILTRHKARTGIRNILKKDFVLEFHFRYKCLTFCDGFLAVRDTTPPASSGSAFQTKAISYQLTRSNAEHCFCFWFCLFASSHFPAEAQAMPVQVT